MRPCAKRFNICVFEVLASHQKLVCQMSVTFSYMPWGDGGKHVRSLISDKCFGANCDLRGGCELDFKRTHIHDTLYPPAPPMGGALGCEAY